MQHYHKPNFLQIQLKLPANKNIKKWNIISFVYTQEYLPVKCLLLDMLYISALDAKGRDYSLLCTMYAQYKCLKNIPDIHQISMKVELSLLCRENI